MLRYCGFERVRRWGGNVCKETRKPQMIWTVLRQLAKQVKRSSGIILQIVQ